MSNLAQPEIENLQATMSALEAQRAVLGSAVVDTALGPLREKLAALQSASEPAARDERRLVTVLFSDVVGSTFLAETRDPEDWHVLMGQLHATVGGIIARHGGTVVQYLGDGLLALFGANHASEADAENAIRAALEIQNSKFGNQDTDLQLRVGIHSGLVLVGELGMADKREWTASGDAMNLAARLQTAAPPGGVLISHDTYRFVRGVFDVEPQPLLSIKGKREPVQTYQVKGVKPRPFRTVQRGVPGIQSRTIGRDNELRQLHEAYLEAHMHHRVKWVQLIGEPGLGKSRLVQEMNDWIELRPERVRILRARAFAGEQNQPFALIRRMWFDRFQIAEDAPLAQAEAKWERCFVEFAGTDDLEAAHALGLLVGLPFHDSPYLGAMRDDPAQVKGRAVVVSRAAFDAVRATRMVAVYLEDLHWADSASLEYLTRVLFEAEATPGTNGLLVIGTARTDWRVPLRELNEPDTADNTPAPRRYLEIPILPLSETATRALVDELLQNVANVPAAVTQALVERASGVPYFAEEVINWLIDHGAIDTHTQPWRFVAHDLDPGLVPQTLQQLLWTRLYALVPAARTCLQRAAVYGRHFWQGGVAALDVPDPQELLEPLQPRGFVQRQPESVFAGEVEWSFNHALLRDVTYESILKRERAPLHRSAAAWLEQEVRAAGREDEFAAVIAEHCELGGETAAAGEWYLRAGEQAERRGALTEARHLLERALEFVPRDAQERRWRALLGHSDVVARLGDAAAHGESVTALLEQAAQLGDLPLATANYRQALYFDSTGNYHRALAVCDLALAAAARARDDALETMLLSWKAIFQIRLGDSTGAAATASLVLERVEQMDEIANTKLLTNLGLYYVEAGDLARALQLHGAQAALNHQLGDRAEEATALVNLGYDFVQLGMYGPALEALNRSLVLHEAIGARRMIVYARLNLGLAFWRNGDLAAARQVLEGLRDEVTRSADSFARAVRLSYLGLVLEQSNQQADTRACFEQAARLFQANGMSSFEADAQAGLARQALQRGDLEAAREYAGAVWTYLMTRGTQGMEFPIRAYLTCAEVATARGDTASGNAALEAGERELMLRADRISNPQWRHSFLEHVPEHGALRARRGRPE